jgi:TIR domain
MFSILGSWKRTPARDRIFISYRRSDTRGYAGRLEDALKGYFGARRVFRDVGGITPGEDFKARIDKSILEAGALIVLIGPNWLVRNDAGHPRLHEPGDHVASEIAAAIESERLIIPVLVDGASMPREEDLPEALNALTRRNAVTISDERWATDVTRLAKVLAFDVSGSVAERRLNWLKLGVLSLLFASMSYTTLMFARSYFGVACPKQAVLYPDYVGAGKSGEKQSWLSCEPAPTQKAFAAGMAASNFVCIVLAVLLLVATSTWVDQSRRKFIWAAVALGSLGTLSCFVFYLRNNSTDPVGALTAMFAASTIIIPAMLLLLALSGFKANDNIS